MLCIDQPIPPCAPADVSIALSIKNGSVPTVAGARGFTDAPPGVLVVSEAIHRLSAALHDRHRNHVSRTRFWKAACRAGIRHAAAIISAVSVSRCRHLGPQLPWRGRMSSWPTYRRAERVAVPAGMPVAYLLVICFMTSRLLASIYARTYYCSNWPSGITVGHLPMHARTLPPIVRALVCC